MIRKAKPSDVNAIVGLTLEYIEKMDPYPFCRVDKDRVKDSIKVAVSGSGNFAWVNEVDGKVEGVLCAATHDFSFYQRKQVSVLVFYNRKPGGAGLMKKFVKWFIARPAIRACTVIMEVPNPRMDRHLVKLGFKPVTMYVGER